MKKHRVKKLFIPHKENDFQPHLLRPRAIAFAILVIVAAEAAFLMSANYIIPRSKLFGIIVTNALIDQTNQNRTSNNLSALHEDALLDVAAQQKANDMAANSYFAHTSPAGLTPWYWFQKVGYDFNYAGENLAVDFSDSKDVTNAWMNSPEHRENILDANYTDIGMAAAQGTFQGHPASYVVELFGAQAPIAVSTPLPGISSAQAAGTQPGSLTSTATTTIVKPKPRPKPIVLATTSNQTSIAIPNIATETTASGTHNASTVVLGFISSDNNKPSEPQLNGLQQAFADPKELANDFYIFLMILFGVALALNIFINIRVQYPHLIFGALVVIVVAGIAVMLNQSAVAHIAIL